VRAVDRVRWRSWPLDRAASLERVRVVDFLGELSDTVLLIVGGKGGARAGPRPHQRRVYQLYTFRFIMDGPHGPRRQALNQGPLMFKLWPLCRTDTTRKERDFEILTMKRDGKHIPSFCGRVRRVVPTMIVSGDISHPHWTVREFTIHECSIMRRTETGVGLAGASCAGLSHVTLDPFGPT